MWFGISKRKKQPETEPEEPKPPADFGMAAMLHGLQQRGYAPEVVYDIGASDGGWTRHAMSYWPAATYVCFEPLAERQDALNLLQAGRNDRLIIQTCGLGDADGELDIGITDALWDSSFAYGGASTRKVPVRRLDTLVQQGAIPLPSFIKIDVQGFERRVMEGGKKTIQYADLILLECSFFAFCEDMCTLDVMIAFMAERNFIPYEFVAYLRRPLDGAMGQCDILFVRKDHAFISNKRWA